MCPYCLPLTVTRQGCDCPRAPPTPHPPGPPLGTTHAAETEANIGNTHCTCDTQGHCLLLVNVGITSHFSCLFMYCLIAYFYFIISCNLAWHYFLYYSIHLIHSRSRDPLYTPRRTQSPLFLCLYTHICAWHRQCNYSPRAVQRHGVESLAVVELFVELVRDLAVLASFPGP